MASVKGVSYSEALGSGLSGKKVGPKEIRSIKIEKAENGGHTVTHRFQHASDGPYREAETHVFGASEGKKLLAHVTKHLDVKAEESEE